MEIQEELQGAITAKEPVLVEFFAPWCPHCQKMMPIVENIYKAFANKIKVIQIDIDKNGELARQYGVKGIPTFFLFREGKELWTNAGEMSETLLKETIKKFI